MWKWAKRFASFVNKDVADPNESKKNAVMTRWICVVMLAYATGQLIFMLAEGYYLYAVFPAGMICAYAAALYLTYSSHTIIAYYMVILLILGWCFLSTDLYGWNVGAQYAYCTILVYIFNGTHMTVRRKLLDAGILLAVGFLTFIVAMTQKPVYLMSRSQTVIQEFMNMMSTLTSLALITVTFSKDTLDTERKLMDYNREMAHQAETDALTGLMNRRAGERYFQEMKDRSYREGFFINVVMGDIDFFKKVNDTYGHDAGDEVLEVLSGIFRETVDGKGAAVRWGGEEFLFLLTGMNGDEAFMMIEKLRRRIEGTVIPTGEEELHVTMTFGLEEVGRDQTMEDVLEAADRKLYMGKARGRNQVVM